MPLDDDTQNAYVARVLDTFKYYHEEKRLPIPEAYHLTLDSFRRSFERTVREAGNDPNRAQREVIRTVGFSPDFHTLDNDQIASEHLESIAQAQSIYLKAYGIPTTHETKAQQARPLRRGPQAQDRTPL